MLGTYSQAERSSEGTKRYAQEQSHVAETSLFKKCMTAASEDEEQHEAQCHKWQEHQNDKSPSLYLIGKNALEQQGKRANQKWSTTHDLRHARSVTHSVDDLNILLSGSPLSAIGYKSENKIHTVGRNRMHD